MHMPGGRGGIPGVGRLIMRPPFLERGQLGGGGGHSHTGGTAGIGVFGAVTDRLGIRQGRDGVIRRAWPARRCSNAPVLVTACHKPRELDARAEGAEGTECLRPAQTLARVV